MSLHPTDPPRSPRRPVDSQSAFPPRRMLPRYKVILVFDRENHLMCIMQSVMDLMHFCRTEATHKMWEAHHWGSSLLLVTWRERAELYAEQFASRGLRVSIEPA